MTPSAPASTPHPDRALRAYQLEALEAIEHAPGRALVVLASGLGKTVLAAALAHRWIARHPGRILYLAHTQEILLQARAEFRATLPKGVTIGIRSTIRTEHPNARVLFATFQSMRRLIHSLDATAFALVIVDEAHHAQARVYRRIINHFTPSLLLGLTATPDRMDGRDIRELFGSERYSYPLASAIGSGWLAEVDYRVLCDDLSINALREHLRRIGEGDRTVSRLQLDRTLFLEERLSRMAETILEAQGGTRRTIVFCRSIEHLEAIQAYLPASARRRLERARWVARLPRERSVAATGRGGVEVRGRTSRPLQWQVFLAGKALSSPASAILPRREGPLTPGMRRSSLRGRTSHPAHET